MRKISKSLANEVADKMVKDTIGKKIADKRTLLKEKGNEIVKESLNPELVQTFTKYRTYFHVSSVILLCCEQLRGCRIEGLDEYPSKDSWITNVEVSREDYDYCLKLQDKISKLNDERHSLRRKIEATLLSLSTPKKIQEFFPEAFKYLPTEEKEKTEIALPIEELQSLLSKYSK